MTGSSGQRTDFAGADIRGADFRNWKLAGANFAGARAGIGRRWVVGYCAGSLLAAALAGVLLGAGASGPALGLIASPEQAGVWGQVIAPLICLLALAGLSVLLLRRGLGAAVAGSAVGTAAGVSLLALFFFDPDLIYVGPMLALALGCSALLAGAVLLAIALVVCRSLFGRYAILLPALAAITAAAAIWETTVGSAEAASPAAPIPAQLGAAAVLAVLALILADFLARRGMAGDARFGAIRTAVIYLLSAGATKFHNADLSDATFAGADLSFVDLRRARLTRTNWQAARGLENAYVGRSYLANLLICQLVVSKQGTDQNFDGLDLTGVNLDDAELAGASFIGANLNQATLRRADLTGAKLVHTQLYDTDLRDACITGAYIEHWGISTRTRFDNVRCEYVYMHLPTESDPDVLRKPDDKSKNFEPGDFSAFIAPIIRSLEYYHSEDSDPRQVTKTLDLIQRPQDHTAIDPALSALALQQLAQRHPEARMQVVALKAKADDTVQIRTVVAPDVERSRMSEEFDAIYAALAALPEAEREHLLSNLLYADEHSRQLAAMLVAASKDGRFYAETSITPLPRVKCLWLAANPLDTPLINLDAEYRAITQRLRASEYRDVFQVIPVLALQPDDLLQALNEHRPKIVQFSGHGYAQGELAFVDEQGRAVPVSADALRTVFAALRGDIRLVILNACYSAEQTAAIAEVIDCVIGMKDKISDDGAIAFAASFYRALGFGCSIRNAFDQAVAAVKLQNKGEETIPQMLSLPGVHPDQMILVAPDLPLLLESTVHKGETP